MENEQQQKLDFNDLWADCAKSVLGFWQSSASTWLDIVGAAVAFEQDKKSKGPFGDWNKSWQDFFTPESLKHFNFSGTFEDVFSSAAGSFTDGFSRFQEWMKTASPQNGSCRQNSFFSAQQEIFQAWMDLHEKEIQPLLHIPQVGLTRFYQEKMNNLVERYNIFQAAMADFQYLLCRPMETSLCELQKQIEKERDSGAEGDPKQYYATWIKILEKHYMELFTSSEWSRSLASLVDEAANFRLARNDIMTDFMQFLPVPTNRDMDEVYKEIYQLKKMVKSLLKKNKEQEAKV